MQDLMKLKTHTYTLNKKEEIFLFDGILYLVVDFINQRNRKLNIHPDGHFEFIDHVSKTPLNEIEQLNKDIYRSIKMRIDYTNNRDNSQETFEKMMQQIHGQDLSNIADLTKEFERKTKRNF